MMMIIIIIIIIITNKSEKNKDVFDWVNLSYFIIKLRDNFANTNANTYLACEQAFLGTHPRKACSPANILLSLSITRLHAIAAEVAIEATKVFFEDVRNVVGDEIFARFLDLLAVRTLVLVIDDTGSMGGMSEDML